MVRLIDKTMLKTKEDFTPSWGEVLGSRTTTTASEGGGARNK